MFSQFWDVWCFGTYCVLFVCLEFGEMSSYGTVLCFFLVMCFGCVFSVLVGVVFWSFAPLSPLGGCVRHTVCGTLLLLCRPPLHPPSDNRSQKLPITTRGVTTEAAVDFL